VKISSDEAFLILHKWHVDLTPVVFVGSLMPGNALRGRVAVVTREGVWNSGEKPASIWGFLLTGKETSFLASKFEGFEYLQPAQLPSDIAMSLPKLAPECGVLALTKIETLVNAAAQSDANRLVSVEETLFLVEDHPSHLAQWSTP
jgi:hypothetical protein